MQAAAVVHFPANSHSAQPGPFRTSVSLSCGALCIHVEAALISGHVPPKFTQKPQRVDAEEEESRRAQVTKIATLVIVGFITVLTVGLVHTVLSGQTSLSGDRPKPKASPSSRAQTSVLDRIRGAFPFTGSFGGLNDDDGNIAHPHLGGYLWLSSNARGGSSTPSVSFVNLAADQPVTVAMARDGGFHRAF